MDTKNGGKWVNRFFTILGLVFLLALAIVRVAVALDLELTKVLMPIMMWLGSIFWVYQAIIGWWVEKSKNNPHCFGPITCTILLATCSVFGLYVPSLTRSAMSINAILFIVLSVGSILIAYGHFWGQKNYLVQNKS